jgi:peptidoglycan/xylan/chitin deacetylase (PgdA/CDA1 family)
MARHVQRGTVIAYHAIGECPRAEDLHNLFVPVDAFRAQMAYLARRRTVVPLESIVGGVPADGHPSVAITFDDAYRNVLTNAGPILARHGFPATVFVATKWIGQRNTWDRPSPCDLAIMTEAELRDAEAMGIDIEAHGHAHIDLSESSYDEALADFEACGRRFSQVLGRRPRYLAYPYLTGSEGARRAARAVGVEAAFSIDVLGEGRYAYERVAITPLDGPRLFALKTSGRYLGWRRSPVLSAAYRLARPVVRRQLRA